MAFDRDLIMASFAMQYSLRLRVEDIEFGEFCALLKGLMPQTPLGRVVAVRAEKNPDVIRKFGPWERKVRSDWFRFLREQNAVKAEEWGSEIAKLQLALRGAG